MFQDYYYGVQNRRLRPFSVASIASRADILLLLLLLLLLVVVVVVYFCDLIIIWWKNINQRVNVRTT
jgi:hypothetical protein